MIKITKYCDICGREQRKNYDNFYQILLPERNYNGDIILSENKSDICKECFKNIYYQINTLKFPNRECPD